MAAHPAYRRVLARVLVLLPLALTIVLAKVSVPPFSGMGLGIGLPLVFLATAVGMLAGAFELHPGRLTLYLLLAIWCCATQLLDRAFSLPSLCLLLCFFVPYTVQLKPDPVLLEAGQDDQQQTFTNIGFGLAILGCLQYAAQYALGPAIAFPIEHFLPRGVLIEGFNSLNPLYFGSAIFKSNGVFFLEPSFFSQFLALSLLVELAHRGRVLRVLVHLLALACTFSGTGLMALAAGGVALVLTRRRWDLVGLAVLLGLCASLFGEALRLDLIWDRASEFSNVGTSGFERFVSWTYLLQDSFWDVTTRVWTGLGAGTFNSYERVARYGVMESPFAKILFEFGLPGMVLYFGLLIYCIASSRVAPALKFGLLAVILMNGAYSESNSGILLTLLLWPMARARAAVPRAVKAGMPATAPAATAAATP